MLLACRRLGLAVVLACVALATGCATVTGSETQAITVETHDAGGGAVAGAECKLSNNNGNWRLKSPATVNVRKSAEDLVVRCEMEDRPPGTARAVSKVNAGMFGNIIVGGVVGAAIDHTKGTAYDYPDVIRVVFGANRVVEPGIIAASSSPPASSPSPAASAPPDAAPPVGGAATMDDLEGLLPGGSGK